jgi:hypothetical protein
MVTAELDYAPWNAAIDSIHNAMIGAGKDASTLLQDQAKLLLRKIVDYTPPPGRGNAAKELGERAISNDLHSLISEAPPELFNDIGSRYGVKNVEAPLIKKDGSELRLVWDNLVANPDNLPAIHNVYRKKNGRPVKTRQVQGQWRAKIVVEKGVREPYIRKAQGNLGRWKAKWAIHGAKLGDKFPAWITRHFPYAEAHTTHKFEVGGESGPLLVVSGKGPDFQRNLARIQDAMRFRIKQIAKLTQLILSNYSKAVASGMKAEAQAHKLKAQGEEAG